MLNRAKLNQMVLWLHKLVCYVIFQQKKLRGDRLLKEIFLTVIYILISSTYLYIIPFRHVARIRPRGGGERRSDGAQG